MDDVFLLGQEQASSSGVMIYVSAALAQRVVPQHRSLEPSAEFTFSVLGREEE